MEEERESVLRLGARGRTVPFDVVRSVLAEGSICSLFCCVAAAFHFRIDFLTFAVLLSLIIEAPAATPMDPPGKLAGDGALPEALAV